MSEQGPAQPVTTEQHLARIAKIKASMGRAQEPSNIFFTQLTTSIAVISTIATQLNKDDDHFNADDVTTKDKEVGIGIGLGLSVLAAIIWYIKFSPAEHQQSPSDILAYFDKTKKKINPWFRRFKTATFFGNNIGSTIGEFVGFVLPAWMKAPIKLGLSTLIGWIAGLIGVFIIKDQANEDYSTSNFFLIGNDGWVRYAKVGMSAGSTIGAAIGAGIGMLFPPFGVAIGFAIGAGLGAVIGFVAFAAGVPLINKIRFHWNNGYQPLESQQTIAPNNSEHIYRINYLRDGLLVGSAVGVIAACVLSLCVVIPLPFLFFTALATAIGALVGGISFALAGTSISNAINPSRNKTSSSWDYGLRNGFAIGGQNGLGLAVFGLLSVFGLDKLLPNLKDVLCYAGGLVCGFIGGLYDAIIGIKKRNANEEECKKENALFIPWSQRAGAFVNLGGFFGGIIGFVIGSFMFPVVGSIVCTMIGTGLGGFLSAGISGVWGNTIYLKYAEFSAFLAEKLTFKSSSTKENALIKVEEETLTSNDEEEMATPLRDGEDITASLSEDDEIDITPIYLSRKPLNKASIPNEWEIAKAIQANTSVSYYRPNTPFNTFATNTPLMRPEMDMLSENQITLVS